MASRVQTVSALIAATFLQSACATSAMTNNCSVAGAPTALTDMTEQEICERFESDLARAIGDAGVPEGLTIALTLHKRGAIEAQLTRRHEGETRTYPAVAVDAMDRALRPDDLARLARAAAQVLGQNPSNQASGPTANQQGT